MNHTSWTTAAPGFGATQASVTQALETMLVKVAATTGMTLIDDCFEMWMVTMRAPLRGGGFHGIGPYRRAFACLLAERLTADPRLVLGPHHLYLAFDDDHRVVSNADRRRYARFMRDAGVEEIVIEAFEHEHLRSR